MELFLGSRAFALEKEFVNLVSIVVDEDTYDNTRSKLVRYSRDIQGVLENTRVVILPTPSDASVLDIASLWESLYLEWYNSLKDVDYESRLIGTVFVGKIPMPTVFDGSASSQTMLPYIDFVDKSYIYNHESQRYEKNNDANTKLSPEIWHGVISPNTGDVDDDILAIEDFFDKNHDFYTGQWVFEQEKWIIDGLFTPAEEDYEPYVFYYDQFREHEALQYQNYIGYESYLENIEDITYNRYSKELAERVSQKILWVQNADIADLLAEVDPDFDISWVQNTPDVNSSSDILTRYITDNSTKKLLEVFNGSTLWEMRKQVYNAGRYNENASTVNMDMPPFLISVLDQVSSEVIKNVNTALETQITDLVTNGLSRNIAIPLEIIEISSYDEDWPSLVGWQELTCWSVDTGFIYGTPVKDITNAAQCSIFRGDTNWGTLVESNRAYNINYAENDAQLCGLWMEYNQETGRVDSWLEWFWGWNSPINLQIEWWNYSNFALWERDELGSIRPLFDILWSKQVDDESKIPSPLDCFENARFIRTYQSELVTTPDKWIVAWGPTCETRYSLPVNPGDSIEYYTNDFLTSGWEEDSPAWTTSVSRFCGLDDWYAFEYSAPQVFTDIYDDFKSSTWDCKIQDLVLGNNVVATNRWAMACQDTTWEATKDICCPKKPAIKYSDISSHILHTSPTDEEFGAQINSRFTPSLPIDSDRYIDFIGAAGWEDPDYGYQRIDFPQLFRVALEDSDNITLQAASEKVKQYLDTVSDQINTVIINADPSSLQWDEQDLYQELETWEYPNTDIDLYAYLQDKPLEVFTLQNESKEISYFDTLVFSVYWNNLDSVASKYKFIFEEYLSNQFEWNDYNFHLPKSKKSYEIGYFAAPGDAQNMYVKLDPELKWIHPYADIISQYLALNTTISWSNVWENWLEQWVFECAPPDGVNIFQWIPAVICWLTDMLPPTIKITDGSCWAPLLTSEEQAEIDACNKDDNKNGINDCLEQKLIGWELELVSDAKFDNSSYISHTISRLVVPADPEAVFNNQNQRVIYDISIPELSTWEAYEEAQKYISYNNVEIRSMRWETKTYFYGKWQDADITFQAQLETKDIDGNVTISLESNDLNVSIRWDRLFIGWYRVEEDARYTIDSTIVASNEQNVCAVDANALSVWDAVLQADTLSQAKEKILALVREYFLSKMFPEKI